ncbi:MAG: hypothetical protein RJA06_58 [Bacteroidota bacterium]
MRSIGILGLVLAVASCGVPKSVVEVQTRTMDRLREDSLRAELRIAAVRDSLVAVERWGSQSEQASLELARELERRADELKLAQLRADSLAERVLRNATQRDVWRLERLAAERTMLAAQRRADSLQEVVVKLQAAPKKRR